MANIRMRLRPLLLIFIVLLGLSSRLAVADVAGVEYKHLSEPGPLSIHVLTFDLARPDLEMVATVGTAAQGSETVPDMVALLAKSSAQPLAAVNGDYFEYLTEPRYRGISESTCVIDGELVAGPAGPTFWVDMESRPHFDNLKSEFTITRTNGDKLPYGLNCSTTDYKSEVRSHDLVLFTPTFGTTTNTEGGREYVLEPVDVVSWLPLKANSTLQARVREVKTTGNAPIAAGTMVLTVARKTDAGVPELTIGEMLTISTALTPDFSKARNAISGAPLLIKDGKIVPKLDNTKRHPRTLVGFAGTKVVLAVVDGRQPTLSIGMSYQEEAELMQRLGCTDALNLDGGGSTTMWFDGKVVNSPSAGALRPVGNALVLLRRPSPAAN